MKLTIIFISIFVLFTSCGIYNFTGSSVAPDIKTIYIPNIQNESGQGPARISINFSERLRDYYQSNTKLQITNKPGADLSLEGRITGYNLSPVAPQGNEFAAQTRLTMSVNIIFENTKDSTQNVKKDFSFAENYPSSTSLSQVEESTLPLIFDQLIIQIFQETVAQW
ncbi:MAG: LptE family protein [Cytophagales bacterium]|nr:LptE family protein [Cytophagales bacterium]